MFKNVSFAKQNLERHNCPAWNTNFEENTADLPALANELLSGCLQTFLCACRELIIKK
jgi:hypothetical protein